MFISESAAQWNDKSDGCGLGWKVTSEKTFSATTTRAVTNVFIPPTFGMSSGTLGCETHGLVQKQGQIKYYVNATFDHLLNDFSNGEGEYLKNYLSFFDCKKAKNNPERTRTFFKNYLTNNSISIDSFINSSHHWIQRSVCAP